MVGTVVGRAHVPLKTLTFKEIKTKHHQPDKMPASPYDPSAILAKL